MDEDAAAGAGAGGGCEGFDAFDGERVLARSSLLLAGPSIVFDLLFDRTAPPLGGLGGCSSLKTGSSTIQLEGSSGSPSMIETSPQASGAVASGTFWPGGSSSFGLANDQSCRCRVKTLFSSCQSIALLKGVLALKSGRSSSCLCHASATEVAAHSLLQLKLGNASDQCQSAVHQWTVS